MENLKSRPLDYWLLWFVALLSLAANVWLARAFIVARRQAGEGAAIAAEAVGELRQSSIDYSAHFEKSLSVSATVPFSTTISIPISFTLPIDTLVTVPLNTPFGTLPITFRVKTSVPVNVQSEVPVQAQVPISTTVPIAIELPIHLVVADTEFGEALARAQRNLEALAAELQTSPLATGRP